jgi:riboflavin synthase
MFTGLIEEIGQIEYIRTARQGMLLRIKAKKVLENTAIGDSIAVDGICLTVTKLGPTSFEADVMPETYHNSRFKTLNLGDSVHLERALSVGDRLGGHFVTGHVDGMGEVIGIQNEGDAIRIRICPDEKQKAYMVHKGSIAVNGVSLTIARSEVQWFEVSIVSHTQGQTLLQDLSIGDYVHLESDMLLKYVHQIVTGSSPNNEQATVSGITMESLEVDGFM